MSERERFEAWAKKISELREEDFAYSVYCPKRYVSTYIEVAWLAWQARCPDGWQCVPVDPTDEMMDSNRNPR